MAEHPLNIIIFKDKTYIRVVPGKRLFQSTMVHSVVNRGDVLQSAWKMVCSPSCQAMQR